MPSTILPAGKPRNGKSSKSVRSVHGELDLEIPRDRNGTFEPQLVKKGETQLHGFDERIIHHVRHSLRYVSWKQHNEVAADLRSIYAASTLSEGERALEACAAKWDELSQFFDYPPQIRKVIYTTNVIESLNALLRKVTKIRRSFPTDEAVMKTSI